MAEGEDRNGRPNKEKIDENLRIKWREQQTPKIEIKDVKKMEWLNQIKIKTFPKANLTKKINPNLKAIILR